MKMDDFNKEYERGFKDGVASKLARELQPIFARVLEGISEVIKSIPSVGCGQWIWDGNKEECICSECGKGNLKYSTAFCPDCGARMDLKEGDTE